MTDAPHAPANVFPGLRPFEPDETYLFFGRDGQSDQLIERLARNRFVAVVGSSGSGKSSLVRAGLLASLRSGYMSEAGSSWRIVLMRPGAHPVASLAHALSAPAALGNDELDASTRFNSLEATLRRSSFGLVEAVRQAQIDPHQNVLVVVDQFEEIFRLRAAGKHSAGTGDEAAAFVKLLLESARQTELPIYVVITMRSDFIGDCSEFRDLPEALNQAQYLIPRMTRDQCREAIEGPIAVGGATISSRLLQRLLNDVGDDPDHLPVLQHALMRTWEAWKKLGDASQPVDLNQYEAIGTMATALSRHADEAYEELDKRGQQLARTIFQRLSEKGKDDRETRRPTELAELCEVADADEAAVIAVIDDFRSHGRTFLTPAIPQTLTGESVIEISHESLIRLWDRLRQWADAELNSATLYRRLADTAVRHAAGGAALWRDPELQLAIDWKEGTHPNAAWAERYGGEFTTAIHFLELSRRESESRKALRRVASFASAVAAVVFAVVGLFAFRELREARRLEALSSSRELASESQLARTEDPPQIQLAALLAIEAARLAPILDSTRALFEARRSLPTFRSPALPPIKGDPPKLVGAMSADGRFVARATGETIEVFDARTGKRLTELAEEKRIRALALSPEGHFLGVATEFGAYLTEVATGKIIWRHQVIAPIAMTLSTRGKYAAVSEGSRVDVFEVANDREVFALPRPRDENSPEAQKPPPPPPSYKSARQFRESPRFGRSGYKAIAFSADGRLFAAAGEDVDNAVYDFLDRSETYPLSGAHLAALAFGPNNDTVVAAGDEVSIFDQTTGAIRQRFQPDETVNAVAIGPEDRLLALGGDRTIQLYDIVGSKRFETIPVDNPVKYLAFGDRSQALVAGDVDRWFTFGDLSDRELSFADAAQIGAIALSPGGRYMELGVVQPDDGIVLCREYDVDSVREVSKLEMPAESAANLAISGDGRYVAAVPSLAGSVPIFVTATGARRPDSLTSGLYSAFTFSADGMSLAVARQSALAKETSSYGVHDSEVLIGRRMDPSLVRPLLPAFPVTSLAFSRDGKYLAAAGSRSIVVYNTDALREMSRITAGTDVRAVAIRSDGKNLIAVGNRLSLYDAQSGAELMSTPLPAALAMTIALTEDERHVVVAARHEKGISFGHYPASVETMIDETCQRVDRNLTRQEWDKYLAPQPYRKTCANLP